MFSLKLYLSKILKWHQKYIINKIIFKIVGCKFLVITLGMCFVFILIIFITLNVSCIFVNISFTKYLKKSF